MEKRKIITGTDFSGVGAVDQAFMRLGIKQKKLFACDWDKYSRQTYILNYGEPDYFPEDVYDREIPKESLDIYVTSPPCQTFSLVGSRKGEDDKRGVLFYNSHEFIKVNKPRYFIFENVKGLLSHDGGRTFNKWIENLGGKSVNGNPIIFPIDGVIPYHIYYKVINAKKCGVPQNRERIFILGIRDDEDNNFSWQKDVPLKNKLKDVLESNVDKKYFLSQKLIDGFINHRINQEGKGNGFKFNLSDPGSPAKAITTKAGSRNTDNYIKEGFINQDTQASVVFNEDGVSPTLCAGAKGYANGYVKVKSATKKGFEIAEEGDSINLTLPTSETRRGRVGKKVAQTLDTKCSQAVLIGAMRGRGEGWEQKLEIKKDDGTSNSLTTVQSDNLLIDFVADYRNDEGLRIRKDGISPCMTARMHSETDISTMAPVVGLGNLKNFKIRRLTPRECFRLMDFPDTFKWDVSDTQAYKQAGNSIVVAALVSILKRLKFD